jgi:Ser/Thr protein kinase RdoA (MazF antagonist)
LSALWFAKLHKLSPSGARNFNRKNSLIETTVPGAKHWLHSIAERQPEFYNEVKAVFEHLNLAEKKFFRSTPRRWLIHGDAHPENVVKISEKKIGVIDFTDLCLADFARDVGSFLQQLDYMMRRHVPDKMAIMETKKLFLETYLAARKIPLDADLQQRIQTYYHWTALRTTIFFLVKEHPEPERARELIDDIQKDLLFSSCRRNQIPR